MLKSEYFEPTVEFRAARGKVGALFLLAVFLILVPRLSAQADFTLQMAPFSPYAIEPGGSASSNITLGTLNGFNGAVDLSCQVAPQQTPPATTPQCEVSPASVTPPTGATATITTAGLSPTPPPALYTVTITGTAGGTTHSAQQNLTVLAVTPQFNITVGKAVAPSSVHAGSGGQATIDINPTNGYSGNVTLACSSVSPVVTLPPVCTFDPPTVAVNGLVITSTLTINTTAPTTSGSIAHSKGFYAVWLPLPMLAMLGLGASASRSRWRRFWGLFALLLVGWSLLLAPACGGSPSSTTTTTTGVTPKNTYTFTLTGVDANGVAASNNGTTSSPTVSLTVD